METNSTQAVSADTTAQPVPVKRWKKGDTREDGMVFWQRQKKCLGGEYWVNPEKYEQMERKRKEFEKKYAERDPIWRPGLKRGQVRGDDMVFLRRRRGREYWVTKEVFSRRNRYQKERELANQNRKREQLQRHICGDVRSDGMLFWAYSPSCARGEWWITPEKFAAKKVRRNARFRERHATDPLFALKCRLRCRASQALKRKGFKKNSKTATMLGCTYEEFKARIEKQFLPGMTWENFSKCHIDHIVPLDAAITEEDVYSLSHYTNLRPMWGLDNVFKSFKNPEEHELPANLHPKVREIWERAANNAPGTPNHQE